MEEFLTQLKTLFTANIADTLLSIAAAGILLVIGFKLSDWFVRRINRTRAFSHMDPTAQSFLVSILSIGLKLLVVIIAAGIVGVSTASIIAVLGSAGLAIGLALQGSLSNFAGGVMLLLFKPFQVGDYIELATGEAGTVKGISIFYTTLVTPDNRKLVIPNGTVSNGSIINTSAMPQRRVDLEFFTAYGTDAETVSNILLQCADAVGLFLDEPARFARITRTDDHSVVFTFRGWCKTEHYWQANFEMQERVGKAFREAGILPPATQFTVRPASDAAKQ